MPRFPSTGKVRVSLSPPSLSLRKKSVESEVKYYGLLRDASLGDLEQPSVALSEVLKDIQDPAEAITEGIFSQEDLDIIQGIIRYNLKNEDFSILSGSSLLVQDSAASSLSALVNPRQRISDRLKKLESFIGRGTLYAGQGATLFKYVVPKTDTNISGEVYSHTNPPPFFTEPITSGVENSADFIPTSAEQIQSTHRVGVVIDGQFVPDKESEYWWSGEYNFDFGDFRGRIEYLDTGAGGATTDPKFPIVKNGNLSFRSVRPRGIPEGDNWGLRFDAWLKIQSLRPFARFIAQVHGHLRLDYFEKTGYNQSTGAIEGFWRTAFDTTDPSTYFVEDARQFPSASSTLGFRRFFVQGGPSVAYGAGTGTKPNYAARVATGGAIDYTKTYDTLEGETLNAFNDGFVPIVIRFWYGQQSESGGALQSKPSGPPSFLVSFLTSENYPEWNDYSSRVHLRRINGAWVVQNDGSDTSLNNFNPSMEVYAYKRSVSNPDGAGAFNIANWILPTLPLTGTKTSSTNLTVSIPGYTPSNEDHLWVVLRNRATSSIPYQTTYLELWQKNLFDPDIKGKYTRVLDMLEGAANYVEPDPAKMTLEENPGYYKIRYGKLPSLNTYSSSRYDGTLTNSLTLSNSERDYDYNHDKLLFIGRQKKSTSIQPLQPEEVRKPGANYTFFEVVSDENGRGGTVTIKAFPTNNMGVLAAGSSGTFGKVLHLADNTKTFSNAERQDVQKLSVKKWPVAGSFDSTQAIKVRTGVDGQVYMYITTGSGTTYNTYDTSGIISTNAMGGSTRDHDIKQLYLSGFKKSNGNNTGSEHYFYGLIGGIRQSLKDVQLSTISNSSTKVINANVFPNIIGTNSYNGTQIQFKNTSNGSVIATAYITSFNSTTNEVTYTISSGSLSANTAYYADVWFNHLRFIKLPTSIVSSTGVRQTTSAHIADGSNVQINYVHNGGYQYSRVDNGAGLSFAETLFFIGDDTSTTENSPFLPGTELPAPPTEIVTPFGYDNSPSDADPGLGGLCYPPYQTQTVELFPTAISTSVLNDKPIGEFDVWWGSRDDLSNLGGKYLEITNRLLLDFDPTQRSDLFTEIDANDKPTFTSSTYTDKLEIELNAEIPEGSVTNPYLYADVQKYSNGNTIKDRYFLFLRKTSEGIEVLTPDDPTWV